MLLSVLLEDHACIGEPFVSSCMSVEVDARMGHACKGKGGQRVSQPGMQQ